MSQPFPAKLAPPSTLLLTEDQVLTSLRLQIAQSSLTEVAAKVGLKPQQLSDILHGRANLSKKALAKLKLRMWAFYERLPGSLVDQVKR